MKKYLLISPLLAAIFFRSISIFAAATPTPSAGDLASQPGIDLSVQSLYGILLGLSCWMTRFILVIIVIMMMWYGVKFLVSRGDPGAFTSARKNLQYGVIGIAVVLGAYTIISTVGNTIQSVGATKTVTAWNNYAPIDCSAY